MEPVKPFAPRQTQPMPARKKGGLAFPLLTLLLVLLTTLVVGAWVRMALDGSGLSFAKWLGLAAGVIVALVVPLVLSASFGKSAKPMRLLFGTNLLVLLVLFGLTRNSAGRALRAHGDWPLEVAGVSSGLWTGAMKTVAGWLETRPEALPAPVAGLDAGAQDAGALDASAMAGPDAAAPEAATTSAAQRVFAKASPGVVVIHVRKKFKEGTLEAEVAKLLKSPLVEGVGSGFVVSEDGLLVTNHHVLGEADFAEVRFKDGRRFGKVTVLADDVANDLTLAKIDAEHLAALPLSEQKEIPEGTDAIAIGSPLGLEFTLTSGLVSATREVSGTSMLQMQTAVAPGSSGGPLLDAQEKVIGVNTAVSGPGMNLAVHVKHVHELLARPRRPRELEAWRAGAELVQMGLEGTELTVTRRLELQRNVSMLSSAVDACVADLPAGGAQVALRPAPGPGAPRPKGDRSADAGASPSRSLSTMLKRLGRFYALDGNLSDEEIGCLRGPAALAVSWACAAEDGEAAVARVRFQFAGLASKTPDLPREKRTLELLVVCNEESGAADAGTGAPEASGVGDAGMVERPDKDQDCDGIPDGLDACPAQAGPADPDPKRNGCAPKGTRAFVAQGKIVITERIWFEPASYAILKRSWPVLDSVAQLMKDHPEILKLQVEGHSDDVGTAEQTQKVSERRAQAVMAHLIKAGVEPERLGFAGLGATRPLVPGDTEPAREVNRRVEFVIADQAEP